MKTIVKKKATKETKVSYSKKPENISFEEWQIALRRQFALEQKFKIKNTGEHPVFSDFDVTNPQTQKTYKVAIRSNTIGFNFCNCPDFKINNLGTCKHIEYVFNQLRGKKNNDRYLAVGYERPYSSVTLRFGIQRKIVLRIGTAKGKAMSKLAGGFFDKSLSLKESAFGRFDTFLERARRLDPQFRCYPDAIDFIVSERESRRRVALIEKRFPKGQESEKLDKIIKTELYAYQKEGILMAAKAGRFIIADDMGLGKTIQAIGIAQLMKTELGIERVLIVCPTSLKYQWKTEIEKFTDNSSSVIQGMQHKRSKQYDSGAFFKIVSYNAVTKDISVVNKSNPDMIILDEAQRIKNWKTKTAQAIKQLQSPYCLVLTGTPLENKLDELHSLVEFVDKYRLGPLSKFLYDHQITNEFGKVIGYKELNKIGESIASICIRRTKREVLKQLPARIDKTLLVNVTQEQLDVHSEHYENVTKLVTKWRKYGFLSEKERQLLMIGLNCMRMVSDSTYILDQKTRHDTKITELMSILDEIFENNGEKVVIFSQWERMTRLVGWELDKREVKYEYLHGGVPAEKRKDLLVNFKNDPESRVFLSTDAGGVGLNLQSASILINLDCPWNPAVLEQRIGRIHRLGQEKPVTIINFISRGTIEERMLELLKFKRQLFEGVLDGGEDSIFMGESKMKQFMKTVEQLTNMPKATELLVQEEAETNEMAEGEINESDIIQEYEVVVGNTESRHTVPENAMNELLQTGLSFLGKLSGMFSDPDKTKAAISAWIEKDDNTGKACLKIPLEDTAIVNKAADFLTTFFSSFKK
jgi:superfamily II DNA or RNA helicase